MNGHDCRLVVELNRELHDRFKAECYYRSLNMKKVIIDSIESKLLFWKEQKREDKV